MRKEEINRTVYSKPEVEIMRIHMDCQLHGSILPGRPQKRKPQTGTSRRNRQPCQAGFLLQ